MAKRQRASSSSLFLMELIMAILFFCIAATICIFVFAQSHIMHTKSSDLNESIQLAGNTAEIIRSSKYSTDITKNLRDAYPDADIANILNDDIIIDKDGYTLTIESTNDNGLLCSVISVYKDSDFIYDLYVEHSINE